jgi:hypothetical protein
VLRRLGTRLPGIARELAKDYWNRKGFTIQDEHDAQHLVGALLREYFDEREEYTPSYAGSSARVDWLLSNEETVVELKHTRDSLGEKEVGNELIHDIARYQAHPRCRTLYCLIYDPQHRISNPRGLESDLMSQSTDRFGVVVHVVS